MTDTPFSRDAARLVRIYLAALMRGDEAAAYAALGGQAGSPGLQLSEEAFLDGNSRITSLRSKGTDNSADVQVEISSAKGLYFARYDVEMGTTGPVIRSHDFIKP